VYVGGVTAYSTLGWFPDPLLNTMLGRTEPELAGVLFHELAHQKLYAKGDTAFNESFATAIEREGVRRWLAARKAENEYPAYLDRQQQREAFIALVMRYRRQLESLFESSQDDQAKRSGKQALLADMREQYAQLKKQWAGYSGYDKWMENLNNARFVSVGLYHDYIPAFEALLAQSDGDLNAFYAAAAKLAQLPPAERSAALNVLSPKLKAQN
jgi:predicted aminopeptidase